MSEKPSAPKRIDAAMDTLLDRVEEAMQTLDEAVAGRGGGPTSQQLDAAKYILDNVHKIASNLQAYRETLRSR